MLTAAPHAMTGRLRTVERPLFRSQAEPLARCEQLRDERRAFGLVTGPAGTGKSDLLRRLAAAPSAVAVPEPLVIDASGLESAALLSELASALGGENACPDAWQRFRGIRDRLEGMAACGRHQLLLLDHLDAAAPEVVSLLNQLLRLAEATRSLTVLAASREPVPAWLAELNHDFGWVRIEVAPLSLDESTAAMRRLLKQAGRHEHALAKGTSQQLHVLTRGAPRQVQRLAELALLAAEVDSAETLSGDLLRAVSREIPSLASAR